MAGYKFERVCIIGVGLIGGSLALDAKDAGWFGRVTGCGRSIENLEAAKELGVVDEYTQNPAEAVRGADLVILATPVDAFIAIAEIIAPAIKEGATVTDVGSVKGSLVEQLEELFGERARFVAGHPVAGREKFGAKAAERGLFKGRRCILTPTSRTDTDALEIVRGLWEAVGMEVVIMEPARHDRILAATSHLPHVVAYALLEAVLRIRERHPDAMDYAAGGLNDYTRIAASSPEMWRDIFLLNSDAIIEMLEVFEQATSDLKKFIEKRDGKAMLEMFEKSRRAKLKSSAT